MWKTSWLASRLQFITARQPGPAMAARLRDLRADAEELADERLVLGREVVHRRDVLARDDEHVRRRLGLDVLERDGVRVLVDDLRRDLLRGDPQNRQSGIGHLGSQNSLRESSRIVTGPSFTSSTSICARKTPFATGSPCSRQARAEALVEGVRRRRAARRR